MTPVTFVKIHGTILYSSIWAEPAHTRLVWITLLVMADQDGIVSASVGGLAHAARVSQEDCEKALYTFLGPDPDSRDGTTGERIEKVSGGWLVLNHGQYRDRQTISQAKDAARAKRYRERLKGVTNHGNHGRHDLPPSEAEAEADTEAAAEREAAAFSSQDSDPRMTHLRAFFPDGIDDRVVHSEVKSWAMAHTEMQVLHLIAWARDTAKENPQGFLLKAIRHGYAKDHIR